MKTDDLMKKGSKLLHDFTGLGDVRSVMKTDDLMKKGSKLGVTPATAAASRNEDR